jgi:hypothetical protein
MLLRVPSDTHDLAIAQGFDYNQVERPIACCMCDKPISQWEHCYRLVVSEGAHDFWCVGCIESKLPAVIESGRALR